MKKLKVTSVICSGILSVATTGLLAQSSSSSQGSSTSGQNSSSLGTSSSPRSSSLDSSSTTAGSSALGSSHSSMHGHHNVRLSELLNSTVQSQDGKTLGYLRDVTVDPQSGRIEFGILSLSSAGAASDTSTSGRETTPSSRSSISGTPGGSSSFTTTGKLIPVPWQMFSQSWSRHHGASSSANTGTTGTIGTVGTMGPHNLVLNMDESKLRSAPSFDASNWNELQGGSFDQRAYSYFGVDRSSGTGRYGSSLSGQGSSSQDSNLHRGKNAEGSSSQDNNSPNSSSPQK